MKSKTLYVVYDLVSERQKCFKSLDKLLDVYKCVTRKRVLHCIKTGQKWKGFCFDILDC